jgi:hypothetical protein
MDHDSVLGDLMQSLYIYIYIYMYTYIIPSFFFSCSWIIMICYDIVMVVVVI